MFSQNPHYCTSQVNQNSSSNCTLYMYSIEEIGGSNLDGTKRQYLLGQFGVLVDVVQGVVKSPELKETHDLTMERLLIFTGFLKNWRENKFGMLIKLTYLLIKNKEFISNIDMFKQKGKWYTMICVRDGQMWVPSSAGQPRDTTGPVGNCISLV